MPNRIGDRAVLFIAAAFPPLNSSGTARSAKFVKYLDRFGWRPVVVTMDWEQDSLGNPLDHALMRDIPAAVPVYRSKFFNPAVSLGRVWSSLRSQPDRTPETWAEVRTYSEIQSDEGNRHGRLYRALRRLYHFTIGPVGDELFYWSLKLLPTCLKIARRHRVAAVYVSVSPWTAAILGVLLKHVWRRPLIVDFRDYWTMWAVKGVDPLRDPLNARVERWILRQADRIICVHHAMADDFERLEPACAGKCRVITNGYDVEDFGGTDFSLSSREQTEVCSSLLTHTGIAWGDAALPLLQALSQLKRENTGHHLRVNFIGGLPASSLRFIQDHQLQDLVYVQKRVPHQEAIERMREADILLLLIVGNEGGRKWYPGKLFEYMYVRRPVLAVAPEGIATQLIQDAGLGLAVAPHETERLTQVLTDIAADVAAFREQYFHPQESVIQQFDRVTLTRKLASVLDEVCPSFDVSAG